MSTTTTGIPTTTTTIIFHPAANGKITGATMASTTIAPTILAKTTTASHRTSFLRGSSTLTTSLGTTGHIVIADDISVSKKIFPTVVVLFFSGIAVCAIAIIVIVVCLSRKKMAKRFSMGVPPLSPPGGDIYVNDQRVYSEYASENNN